ncbi:MAG: heparan-alpha-glucosaminide N-acetyltransferase domain-containing protein [Prevotellaceae bacterium]|jgi:predicted acyltransferase|nr:heparan-alpha-glucosaminide N-acetyltransferase domain-containing protein [Prevotellaceae bacterium]
MQTTSSRLLSLDVLRGITIAGMILVNNPGSWQHIYTPLQHARWDGLTPTDLVFPFFMFIMGVSIYLSYKKFDFRFSHQTCLKLVRRSLLLFLIGLFLNYFGLFCRTLASLRIEEIALGQKWLIAATDILPDLRIMGVLQRLALASLLASMITLCLRRKALPWLIGGILVVYGIGMIAAGSLTLNDENIVGVVDRAVLGTSHMYKLHGINFEPEGLLSTLPCIAHVLIGVVVGRFIDTQHHTDKIRKLFLFGTVLLFAGLLLQYALPINKSLWSSTYVLVTCGLASLLFGLLIWLIDIKGWRRGWVFFESFGINPMAIFVIGGILTTLIGNIGFTFHEQHTSLKGFVYDTLLVPYAGYELGSLLFALLFVGICWGISYILYRKNIYIKI